MDAPMGVRVEVDPNAPEEVILRCRSNDERTARLERQLRELLGAGTELEVTLGDTTHFIPTREILFFESDNGRIAVHTAKNQYYIRRKLFELETLLPLGFLRVSKSCILNAAAVSSITRNLTGASRVTFRGSEKAVYVSRAYYHLLYETISDLRLRSDTDEGRSEPTNSNATSKEESR